MSTKLRTVTQGGFHWLVADTDTGVRVPLHVQAKTGDCFRPGQRMKGEPGQR